MYLLSYFGCVQVVLIVSQLVYSSHSLPLDPSPRFDIGILIDPLNEANNDDLESKKVIAKSVFNTPLRTPPPATNRCPPGYQSLEDGSCVKTISGIAVNEETWVAVLDNFYKKQRRPPARHRYRTTTPRLKVEDSVPTTTEVITERTVPFESTTPQPSLALMQQQVAAANPTVYPEPTPNPATTTILSTSANEPGGYQISNQQAPFEAQEHQNYELVPTTTTTTPTEYITEVSVPMEFIIYSTLQPPQSTPVQIFRDTSSPPNNPIILRTITSNHTSSPIEPDGNNHDNNETNTTSMPSPLLLHELQQINDELFPTTTTTTTPSSKLQEIITEVYVSVSSLEELKTTTAQSIPALSSDETSPLELLSNVKDVAQSIYDPPTTLPDIVISASSMSILEPEVSKNQETTQENPSVPPFLLSRHDEAVEMLQEREETKSQEEAKYENARQSQLHSSEVEGTSRQERDQLKSGVVVLQEPKEDDKEPEKSSNLSSSSHENVEVETIIVPVSSTSESTIDSTSSSNAVIKEPF